jgi:ATP-dependent DNA helicase RecQ
MKDQVDELNRRGIPAAALHSMLSTDARRQALAATRRGEIRLLYVAPERFASEHFFRTLRELPVARFVVDEAHCVSEWGHDFRPDYRRLRIAAAECRRSDAEQGRPPIAAFTATATPEVRDDIVDLLGLADARVIVAGFDRPNITLHVRPVAGEFEKHQLLPQLVGDARSLVYAATRRNAEMAAEMLKAAGMLADAYHAGLSDAERSRVQDGFASGALRVVCATNAFGMGIDRPDVEAVVHVDIPGSLEAYYQEIGRSGRDGRQAVATLLWNYADVKTREFLIDRERDDPGQRRGEPVDPSEVARRKEIEHKKLRRMVAYAESAGCLRATILRYFGDPAAREPCEACGNCERRRPLDSASRLRLRKILSGIARARERYGRRKIAAMLVGDLTDLPESLTGLSTTGLMRDEDPRTIERWIDAASGAGLIRISDDRYRTLSLTPLGRDVMAGRVEDVQIAAPVPRAVRTRGQRRRPGAKRPRTTRPAGEPRADHEERPGQTSEADGGEASVAIVAALREWRLEEARRRAIAPFVILHDRTLVAIAASLPRSLAELHAAPGMGPAKIAAYGDAILAIVAKARTASQIETNP